MGIFEDRLICQDKRFYFLLFFSIRVWVARIDLDNFICKYRRVWYMA